MEQRGVDRASRDYANQMQAPRVTRQRSDEGSQSLPSHQRQHRRFLTRKGGSVEPPSNFQFVGTKSPVTKGNPTISPHGHTGKRVHAHGVWRHHCSLLRTMTAPYVVLHRLFNVQRGQAVSMSHYVTHLHSNRYASVTASPMHGVFINSTPMIQTEHTTSFRVPSGTSPFRSRLRAGQHGNDLHYVPAVSVLPCAPSKRPLR